MQKDYLINQKIIFFNIKFQLSSKIDYCSQQEGTIKGVKILRNQIKIYLIEFLNHNRIWTISEELALYCN